MSDYEYYTPEEVRDSCPCCGSELSVIPPPMYGPETKEQFEQNELWRRMYSGKDLARLFPHDV